MSNRNDWFPELQVALAIALFVALAVGLIFCIDAQAQLAELRRAAVEFKRLQLVDKYRHALFLPVSESLDIDQSLKHKDHPGGR